jgi:hypothetical protein
MVAFWVVKIKPTVGYNYHRRLQVLDFNKACKILAGYIAVPIYIPFSAESGHVNKYKYMSNGNGIVRPRTGHEGTEKE